MAHLFAGPVSRCVVVSALGTVLGATGADAGTLQPHRAIYDLNLLRSEASASMVSAKGRLVFELAGSVCEGFTVTSRFVTRVVDREGTTRVTDLRSSTFETVDKPEFDFVNQTYIDDGLQSVVKGSAAARSSGIDVTLTEPKTSQMELPRAVFPTAHTMLILDAAANGDNVLEAPVFDGGENADKVYATTTVIGPPETGTPGASPDEMAALSGIADAATIGSHHLTISYFALDGAGESTPEYVLTFEMLDNGISYDATFDYGSFELSGKLAELTVTETEPCTDGAASPDKPAAASAAPAEQPAPRQETAAPADASPAQ